MIIREPWYISNDQISKLINILAVNEEEVQYVILYHKIRILNNTKPIIKPVDSRKELKFRTESKKFLKILYIFLVPSYYLF